MTAPENEARLLAASWLLDAGAGASACRLLEGMRGSRANDLREASASVTLQPGVAALVVHDQAGLVFPLRPRVGLPSAAGADLRAACGVALALVRAWFEVPSLPALRLELEDLVEVSGTSLALPAALAFITHFAPPSAPRIAVLATGRLDADGRVLPVTQIEAKLAAAKAEEGERIVLVPAGQRTEPDQVEVRTLAEAIAAALGPARSPSTSMVTLDAMIERARAEREPLAAVGLLEALDPETFPPADRARVHLELGSMLRHAGRTDAAAAHHERARSLLETQRRVIGAETAERYELEVWLTETDQFRLDAARASVEARLQEPFLSARNELRCRGMLAQILAMQGELAAAVRVREANLELHALSDELRRALPGTLCYLALDSARAGEGGAFARWASQLVSATRPGDVGQWRYNASAIVRGLVALHRDREAIAWADGSGEVFGALAPPGLVDLFRGTAPIATHPETTTVRSLVRALRRVERNEHAIALGARTRPTETTHGREDLVAWLARIVDLEVALAESNPAARIAAARAELGSLHRAATAFHARMLTCEVSELEGEIDRVYY